MKKVIKIYGTNTEKCLVKKSVILGEADYKKVSNSLLDDRPELWQEIGGSTSDDPIFENVESYQQFCVMMQNPATRKIYQDTCYTYIVEVINEETGERFFVNTEGYNYARYASLEYEPEMEFAQNTKPQTEKTIPHGIGLATTLITADKMGFKVGFKNEAERYFYEGVMPQPSLLLHFERAAQDAQKQVLKQRRGDEADKISERLLDEYLNRKK